MRNAQAAGKNQFRNCCKVLTASPPTGLSLLEHWLRPIPARMAPSFTGADNHRCEITGVKFWVGFLNH